MSTFRRLCALVCFLVLSLGFVAAAFAGDAPASPTAAASEVAKVGSPDDVLATIGEVKITRAELEKELERMGPQAKNFQGPDGKKNLLDQLVEVNMLELEANKQGIADKPENAKALQDAMSNMLAIFYMREALDKVKIPDEDVEKYYKEHQNEFTDADRYHVFQMTFATQDAAVKAKKELDGGKSFADMAKADSTDNFKAAGGDRGFVPGNELHPMIVDSFKVLKINELSGPVKLSETEYWVGKYSELTKGALKELAAVSPDIKRQLLGEKQKGALADLKKEMQFKIDPAVFELLKKESLTPEEQQTTLCTIGTDVVKIAGFLPEMERIPAMFRAQLIEDFVGQYCDREVVKRYISANLEKMTKSYPEAVKAARRRVGIGELLKESVAKKIQVTDEDLKDYYAKNLAQFAQPERVKAHHILVDKEEKAKELLAAIEKKEKTLEELAQTDSKCPSGKQGGDLGFFSKGQMVKEFDDVAQTAEINKVVGPIKTQFGYHLIRVDERKASGTASLEEVKDYIKQQMLPERQKKAYEEFVAGLRKAYPIQKFAEKL